MHRKLKIFIIDDNELDLFITGKILSVKGYTNVRTFSSPLEALGEIEENNVPDLIFLDLNMPLMDGFKFLIQLNMLNKPDVKVFILSSSDSRADMQQAKMSNNVVDYLIKPLTELTIETQLEKFLIKA